MCGTNKGKGDESEIAETRKRKEKEENPREIENVEMKYTNERNRKQVAKNVCIVYYYKLLCDVKVNKLNEKVR